MSDDYGRKRMLLLSYSLSCVGYFSLGFTNTVSMMVLSRISSGLLKHGLSISKAYLVDITDSPSQRSSVLGYFNAVSSTGFIIGPLIAGYLADIDPTLQLSILAGACAFSVNLFVVFFLLPPSKKDLALSVNSGNGSTSNFTWHHVFKALTITKGLDWWEMKGMICVRVLGMLSVLVFRYDFPIFMEQSFSTSNTVLGQITSYNSLASVLASATCGFTAKRYPQFFRQALPSFVLLFLSLLCMALAPGIGYVLVSLCALSVATSYLRIAMLNLMLERGRGNDEGAILGFTNSLSSLCRMLAPTLVGVAQEFGSQTGGCLAALLALMAVLVLMLVQPHRTDSRKFKL